MAQPLDTTDPLLMSDDERTAFLTPDIRPNLPMDDFFRPGVTAARVRIAARMLRAARLESSDMTSATEREEAAA